MHERKLEEKVAQKAAMAEAKDRLKADAKALKERLKRLSPEQCDVVLQRLAGSHKKAADRQADLVPRSRGAGDDVPLSFAQEREWFLDCVLPTHMARNISGALRLEGRLSTQALSAAFDRILQRHETLRASFRALDGRPTQTIRPAGPLTIERIDLAARPRDERESECRRLYAEEVGRRFVLARDCLLRVVLIRIGAEEHLLVISMHHIASDGWSIGVLMEELREYYTSFVESRTPHLPELTIRYGDFAAWQRQRVQDGALDRELPYWRAQLENPPPVLELLPDRLLHADPPSSGRDLRGAICSTRVDRALKQELDELSRAEDTTLFVTVLSAFLVLLMRCTQRDDIVIGCPVTGRPRVETESLIGLFLNTIAIRARLTPELTFRQTIAAVRKTVLDGLEHAEVPFQRVVQDLDLERSSTRHPLFEVFFNFTPSPPRSLDLPGLRASFVEPPAICSQFSTELFVTETACALELKLLFQSGRYSEPRMSCVLEQLHSILRQVVRDPSQRIGEIDLAGPSSRALLPDATLRLDEPPQTPVARSIADWAARTPDQPAVCQGGETLTYGQLGAGMARVAERLRACGLESGQVVAVLGARSHGLVVSMSGVLLSGGVLLTTSRDLPAHRLRLMLTETDARFLLHVGEWMPDDDWLRDVSGLTILRVGADGRLDDRPAPGNAEHSALDPGSRGPAQELTRERGARRPGSGRRQPAYVFFTSGSTGRPKAVLGVHSGLAHWLSWQRQTFAVGPGDRCGQLTGLSFDVVLRDVFLPLTSGATLVLPTESDTATGEATLRWLEGERVSLLHTVPSVAETWLLGAPREVSLAGLRRIFFAGEPLTSSLVARWRQTFPQAGEIVNLYGPTETTLAKCFYRVPENPRAGVQPVGAALPQCQALVLTEGRRVCGIGEPGEIVIRTPFRSLGYLNTPDESAKRFIPSPFSGDPDDVLYLTGDRGAYNADGSLEFLGRLDHQVKVRGVRVEPAEIAATLQTCPEVATCAVVARDDGRGGPALVAYVVPANGAPEDVGRLQQFLRHRLPAPMVPFAFVFLDSLPLTPNQKLDRERLPTPTHTRPRLDDRYLAPRDATELRMVQLWDELLDVRPIGVRDSFFELGGHSLLVLHLLARIEQTFGTKVSLASVLESATVEHLAAAVRRQDVEWPRIVTLWSGEHRLKLFLVHPGGGVLWNYVHLVRHLAPELPVYGLQARGLDGKDEPHDEIEQMAADYTGEIRRVQPEGPYLLAGHSLGGLVAFEIARRLHELGQRVALLAIFDSTLPRAAAARGPVEDERLQDARSLADMVAAIERFLGKAVGVSYESLRELPGASQLDHVIEAIGRLEGVPLAAGIEMTRNLLKVGKAHVRARRAYQARVSPVPITLFRARDAGLTDADARAAAAPDDESLGWSRVSTAPVRVLWCPGDHVSMMGEPHVTSLTQSLRSCLAEAIGSS